MTGVSVPELVALLAAAQAWERTDCSSDADAALIVALRNHAGALLDVADVLREVGAWLSGGDITGYEVVLASIDAALARLDPKETP